MVVGETQNGPGGGGTRTETGAAPPPQPQAAAGPPAIAIDNIMSGIGNTGTVKMNNHRKKLRQRFDIIKKLGQGTYGKVQLGINKETSQEVAIKTIKKCKIETEADLIRIRREVQIMSSVQHPNIIHIYEVFENREKMVLVMEFAAGGELYDYLSERKVLSEDEARRVFRQVATAVYYCHKHKICHRDLKLENILLDEHGNAKIADFGLSNVFDEQRLLATFCGSPLYASPEIVKGTPYQGPEVDCWSLGVLLYTLVYGAMPFDGSNFKRLVKQISQGDYYEPKKPSPASPLIREMLTVCPIRRANIERICNHWWVNEGYPDTCLNVAEELANQTPVRLDVLLSLTPSSVTAEQLVVPNPEEGGKGADRVVRSHSVGSIVDMANTEAEQRIIDMVQAGGEAALMPSPTRTITPSVDSPAQPKRKLETTMSMDNAIGAKKKERADQLKTTVNSIAEQMDVVETMEPQLSEPVVEEPTQCEVESVHRGVVELEENMSDAQILPPEEIAQPAAAAAAETLSPASPPKAQRPINKNKTTELVATTVPEANPPATAVPEPDQPARKNSLPECLGQSTEKRRSRIFETAEKLQSLATQNQDKSASKFPSSGAVGSVNNFKKEFERRASLSSSSEKKSPEKSPEKESRPQPIPKELQQPSPVAPVVLPQPVAPVAAAAPAVPVPLQTNESNLSSEGTVKSNDSKTSLHNFSLEDARRSMENSIALLNKARNESNPDVDQLCEQTENVAVSTEQEERQRKLKNAREIIGVRKPPVPFGANGRSISGSVVPASAAGNVIKPVRAPERRPSADVDQPSRAAAVPELNSGGGGVKTSRAEIVLKSNTLPRRKPAKTEIQLDIKTDTTPQAANPMRFSTEMQHQVPDLRSAPIAGAHSPFSPVAAMRANSVEPQAKEHFVPVARPPAAASSGVPGRSSTANTVRSSLSRQSTNDSDTETTTTAGTQSTINVSGSGNQPIKKSPREFIIPIKMEGGGVITPRAGSLEPSESGSTFRSSASTVTNASRPKRLSSLLGDRDQEDDSLFGRMHRHTSLIKDNDLDDAQRFPSLHRLRTTRPIKKVATEQNDSGSSDEENDDEDGFEILTAEKLFSTLLQRVRALTNRVNVNQSTTSAFPSPRLMSTLRQSHSPFWHHDPFAGSTSQQHYSYRSETIETKVTRLSNNGAGGAGGVGGVGGPWASQMTRDLTSNLDSMFSRSGATLPRGTKFRSDAAAAADPSVTTKPSNGTMGHELAGDLDLRDLDLSQLRLTKRELEALSSLTIPKKVQDQLLAQLPPNQARKLSRTLSQNDSHSAGSQQQQQRIFKRSSSGGRELCDTKPDLIKDVDAANNSHRSSGISLKPDAADKHSRSPSRGPLDSGDDLTKSFRSSYSSDTSERFKLLNSESGNQIPRYYDTLPSRGSSSSSSLATTTVLNRPPRSGCLSPPPPPLSTDTSSVRRRSSQRRISRFLRPDFYDTPLEESIYLDQHPTSESGRILKDIRERSRERSSDRRRDSDSDRLTYPKERLSLKEKHKSCMPDIQNHQINCPQYSPELIANTLENIRMRQRSQSRSRDESEKKIQNTDSILDELQNLSNKRSNEIRKEKVQLTEVNGDEKLVAPGPSEMVTKLNNEIDSVNLISEQKKMTLKRESKLIRPKSYPSKDQERASKSSSDKDNSSKDPSPEAVPTTTACPIPAEDPKSPRTKSFQPSKITPPKEVKKDKKSTKSSPKTEESKVKLKLSKKSSSETEKQPPKDNKSPEKAIKKSFLQTISQKFEKLKESSSKKKAAAAAACDKNNNVIPNETEGKSVPAAPVAASTSANRNEKAVPTTKVAKDTLPEPGTSTDTKAKPKILITEENENNVSVVVILKKKSGAAAPPAEKQPTTSTQRESQLDSLKSDKKSKIDDMIRNLRERSVPRGPQMTESHLIKRAVSVEELPGAYNSRGVNKVLGLFKKIEKDGAPKLSNTKSNATLTATDADLAKERPKSSGFVSKLKKTYPYVGAKSDSIVTITDQRARMDKMNGNVSRIPMNLKSCPDCKKDSTPPVEPPHQVLKREVKQTKEEKDRIRNNRKGLMLDLSNPSYTNSLVSPSEASSLVDGSTPKEEMVTSLTSSESKPPSDFDDCGASSSTFLSPMEEPELYFDNWSVCSDDRHHSLISPPLPPLPTQPHPHHHHAVRSYAPRPMSSSTPANQEYDPENMLDRIRRKSFYTRFNEKKPKRVSSIVGPGALKDYYAGHSGRESVTRSSSRGRDLSKSSTGGGLSSESPDSRVDLYPSSRRKSSSAAKPLENGNHHLSNGSASSASSSSYRMSTSDYLNNNGHLHHHHPPPSSSSHLHYHHHHHLPPSTPSSSSSSSRRSAGDELKKYSSDLKASSASSIRNPLATSSSRSNALYSSVDNRSNSSIYGTYNPKRRISYGNSSPITTSSAIPTSIYQDATAATSSYATLGRKPKSYDQRTVSLLDNSPSLLAGRSSGRSALSDYGRTSNFRIRTPSITRPRSPATNI